MYPIKLTAVQEKAIAAMRVEADKKAENIRIIKECADLLTLEETERVINYMRRNIKIEIH